MQLCSDNIQDRFGTGIAGASVLVTLAAGGALPVLYSDNGITPTTNPILTDAEGEFAFYAANGRYTLTATGPGIRTAIVKDFEMGDLLEAVASVAGTIASSLLLTWAYTQAFQLVGATRNSDGAITSATIKWPDGVNGVFTSDTLSTAFPGAIDAWHATYAGATTKTVTQPLVTRDSIGAVTVQPAITIV